MFFETHSPVHLYNSAVYSPLDHSYIVDWHFCWQACQAPILWYLNLTNYHTMDHIFKVFTRPSKWLRAVFTIMVQYYTTKSQVNPHKMYEYLNWNYYRSKMAKQLYLFGIPILRTALNQDYKMWWSLRKCLVVGWMGLSNISPWEKYSAETMGIELFGAISRKSEIGQGREIVWSADLKVGVLDTCL